MTAFFLFGLNYGCFRRFRHFEERIIIPQVKAIATNAIRTTNWSVEIAEPLTQYKNGAMATIVQHANSSQPNTSAGVKVSSLFRSLFFSVCSDISLIEYSQKW
jgi:hypothetical protein